jgi:hypothetical protein
MKQIIFIGMLILILQACIKPNVHYPAPPVPLQSDLIDGPWQLTSFTNINSFNVPVNTYNGTAADSVLFLWEFDNNYNVVLTNINSFIGGNNTLNGYRILSQGESNLYDTIVCSNSWKVGYSDTLFVSYFTDQLLIFQVRPINGNGAEIDSLKKSRFY